MRRVFLAVVFICLFTTIFTSCTKEALTTEEETELLTVDPSDDGTIEDDPEEEPIQD